MSTVAQNPTLECPPTALGACPPPLAAAAPPAAYESPSAAAPRPPKSALLPEIARLSLTGHSGRAIGRRLHVPQRTVARWLAELQQEWAQRAAEDAGHLVSVTLARLELAYRDAMEAWQQSLADKEVTAEAPGGDGRAAAKTSVRRTTQSGQAALLGKAIQAAKEIYAFRQKHLHAVRQAEAAEAQAKAAEADRRCCELAEEIKEMRRMDKSEFEDLESLLMETGKDAEYRDPEELVEVLDRLPAEVYRRLWHILRNEYDLRIPFRRTIARPADVEAASPETGTATNGSFDRATVEAASEPAPGAEHLGASLAESGYTPV